MITLRNRPRAKTTAERVAALCLIAPLMAPEAFGANIERGRALYENHCQVCHSSKVHRREPRVAPAELDIYRIVWRWQEAEKLDWSHEDIDDVVQYLRLNEYRQ